MITVDQKPSINLSFLSTILEQYGVEIHRRNIRPGTIDNILDLIMRRITSSVTQYNFMYNEQPVGNASTIRWHKKGREYQQLELCFDYDRLEIELPFTPQLVKIRIEQVNGHYEIHRRDFELRGGSVSQTKIPLEHIIFYTSGSPA